MARIKTVFGSHKNTAHIWASQSYESGRSSDSRMQFSGATIYSYRTNYPIGVLFIDRNGVEQAIFNLDTYSSSTATHISYARGACSHLPNISGLQLSDLHNFSDMVRRYGKDLRTWPNEGLATLATFWKWRADSFARHMVGEEGRAERARKNGPWIKQRLASDIQEAIALGAAFGFPNHSFGNLEKLKAEIEAERIANAAQYRAQEKARKEKEAARIAEIKACGIEAQWYAGNNDGVKVGPHWYSIGNYCDVTGRTLLRRSKDGATVQTSRGADVPWLDALRLYTIAKRVIGKGYEPPPDVGVGAYKLRSIDESGNVTIGCHVLEIAEMDLLAAREGVAI